MGHHGGWQEAAGRRLGIGTVEFVPTRVGQTLHLPCARGHRVDFEINQRFPPDQLARKLAQAGWTVGSKLLCPKHTRKRRPDRERGSHEQENITMTETPKTSPSEAARAKRRDAMDMLTLAFKLAQDGKSGTYQDGYSDAKIAKETGLAEKAVADLREDFFGPLGEPAELGEFRDALRKCRDEIAAGAEAARQAVRTLELRLDRMVDKLGLKE